MRNAYRRHPAKPSTARHYLELIRTTLADPPKLTQADKARLRAELALPRVERQGTLFGAR